MHPRFHSTRRCFQLNHSKDESRLVCLCCRHKACLNTSPPADPSHSFWDRRFHPQLQPDGYRMVFWNLLQHVWFMRLVFHFSFIQFQGCHGRKSRKLLDQDLKYCGIYLVGCLYAHTGCLYSLFILSDCSAIESKLFMSVNFAQAKSHCVFQYFLYCTACRWRHSCAGTVHRKWCKRLSC